MGLAFVRLRKLTLAGKRSHSHSVSLQFQGVPFLAFHVHIADADRAYLEDLPLSLQAKERLNQFVEEFVANVTDEFRLDPNNRPGPNSALLHGPARSLRSLE